MGRWEKHTVDSWLILSLNLKLLALKIFLHDELALSELTKKNFVPAVVDVVVHKLFSAVSEANAFAAT